VAKAVRWDLIADPSKFNRGFREAEKTTSRFDRHMRNVERSSMRFSSRIGRIGPIAVTAFGGAAAAIGGLAAAGAVLGIKTAANLETAEIGFTRLLGSGKKARVFLGELKSFAARTPFELPGLVDASRALVGAGVAAKNVIPILTALGDASGALGLDQERFGRVMTAVTQVMNKGKLQAEEMMQITEAGIPVWQLLAKATGKPIPELQKLMQAGKLLSKDVLPLLFDQMHKDYGGGMAQQSKTLAGIWSTVKDTIALTMADALKPLVPLLKDVLPAAATAFQTAVGKVTKFFTEDLRPELGKVRKAWDDNKDAFASFVGSLGTGDEKLKTSSQHARDLSAALAGLIDNAGKVARALDRAGAFMDVFSGVVELGALKIHLAGANVVLAIGKMAEWMARLGVGAGHLLNALDRLSGGTGHAGDSIVHTFQDMQRDIGANLAGVRAHIAQTERKVNEQTTAIRLAKERTSAHWRDAKAAAARELGAMRTQMNLTQRTADRLHGKTIPIKATASLTGFGALGGTALVAAAHGRAGGGPAPPGGRGPTADDRLVLLSTGEHVWSAREVVGAGGHGAMELMRAMARRGLPAFAEGGPVVAEFQAVDRGIGRIQGLVERIVTRASITIVKKAVKALQASFAGSFGGAGGAAGIKAFIRSVDPLPYVWGAAGPGAYDCSGLVGAVYGKMRGDRRAGHGARYFTTGSISTGVPGLRSGFGGTLNIGVTPGSGHMAGNYGGLGFEARGHAAGILVGGAARSPATFARHFHMATGGVVTGKLTPKEVAALLALPGVDVGGDQARTRFVFGQKLDRGGWLPPGLSLAYNGTGRPEPVGPAARTINVTVPLTVYGEITAGQRAQMHAIAEEMGETVAAELSDALARRGSGV
jgi:tape measure domain-containing protein